MRFSLIVKAWTFVTLVLNVANSIAQDALVARADTSADSAPSSSILAPTLASSQGYTLRNKSSDSDATSTTAPDSNSSSGFIGGSHVSILFRNFSEYLEIHGYPTRTGWVQGIQGKFESGFTDGYAGFGLDLSPFVAVKLNGGEGARNMVHVGPAPTDANEKVWAYMGGYAFKVKLPGVIIKYGLQTVVNPFLEPYDTRALPPTFKGISLEANPTKNITIHAGSFDAVDSRGTSYLQPLSTSYGGIRFDRLLYLGSDWEYSENGKASFYVNQAKDLWNQYYVSMMRSIGNPKSIKFIGRTDIYYTRDTGKKNQGDIDNKAYSFSLTANHNESSFVLAYQRILGDQFFDFTQETSGIYLSNSMGTDFNAPHEQSIQLRYKFDGDAIGIPGLKASLWAISGWGVNASAEASTYSDIGSLLHDVYWKSGQPLHGGHQEFGFNPSYTIRSGTFKDVKVLLVFTAHNITPYYPSKTFRDTRLMVDFPLRIF